MGEPDITMHLGRLLLAMAAGMAIGLEREWREKAAGFRTLTLVSTGAALIVLLSDYGSPSEGPRLAAGVITGIGFLGAGVILRDRGEVYGLTTAAAVWMAAALGLAAGLGAYVMTVAATALSLFVLVVFPVIDISKMAAETRIYEVVTADDPASRISGVLREAGLMTRRRLLRCAGGRFTSEWTAIGKPVQHEAAIRTLLGDGSVVEFSVR